MSETNVPVHPVVRLCELHEDLGPLHPRLQYFDTVLGWTESGVITGRVSKSTLGKYREVLETNRVLSQPEVRITPETSKPTD